MLKKQFIFGGLVLLGAASAPAVDNPVSVALDGSILRYNGAYYAMDAQTNGLMCSSDNLLDWGSPTVVLPPDVAGPYELLYRNGVVYIYAQDQEFAAAAQPLEPFSNIARINVAGGDLRLFQDKSGALFSLTRQPGSKKEGEIGMQRHAEPWQTVERPKQLLDARPGTWDSIDSADLGAPEMLDYRGNYYLLYAGNHPGPRTGLREIGVAMNENPARIDDESKLPDPVLMRNTERLARTWSVVLSSGEYGAWEGRYATTPPDGDWTQPGFKMAGWRTGEGGFGSPDEDDGAQLFACRTKWTTDQLWVRREFDLPQGLPQTPVLNIRHEGAVQVFLNGKKVFESATPSLAYSNFDLTEAAAGAFLPKGNILAVLAVAPKDAAFRFLDFGLYDAGGQPVEPTVYGLDAPRVVTGPNGFEKWLAYRAWWNGVPGTGIDRIFFHDKQLVVDGPTTARTPGYHPPPASPTFSDAFLTDETSAWTFNGGAWKTVDGTMQQTGSTDTAMALLKREPAANYLFETGIRFPVAGKGEVGVVAFKDGQHCLTVGINPSLRVWSYSIEPGSGSPKRFKLPASFQLLEEAPGFKTAQNPLHRLRVTKNGGHFDVQLDEIRLTLEKPIITPLEGAGVPGLYCRDSAADFDAVVYTVGWDEQGEYITGWGSAADGTPPGGEWFHDREHGLKQKRRSEPGRAFKGDLLDQYEFTVNAQTEEFEEREGNLYGVFPVFVDQNNYLKAMIDTANRQLVVSGRRNGREIAPQVKPLQRQLQLRHLYDKNTSYRDIAAWVYSLRSPSVVSALDVRWFVGKNEYLRQEFFVPADALAIRYADLLPGREPILGEDDRFYGADEPRPRAQLPGILNHFAIRPVVGNYVGLGLYSSSAIVVDSQTGKYIRGYTGEQLGSNETLAGNASDTVARPQETLVTVDVESSYFFRCVKLKDRVVIELNGEPMLVVEGAWPPSQIGLLTEGQPCFFDGITLMDLPPE